jgi:3-oxoacyl-[acyl-carrier protein] reductase
MLNRRERMNRFADRVVMVTGGARGIGLATAQRFADEGASVAILDLDHDTAAQAAATLTLAPRARATACALDVADPVAVEASVDRVARELGAIHVLVNNAGITRDNLLFKMDESDWDAVMSVHLKGTFLMSRAAQGYFVAQRYGRIVNLSSVSALGSRGQANYSAAKMGLQGLTRTLGIELGPFGITVNAVAPGFIASDMTDATATRLGLSVDEFRARAALANPVRRVGEPADVAAAIEFLASDDASYITGQTLYVDGGVSLGT